MDNSSMAKYCINFSGVNTLSGSVCTVWHERGRTNTNVTCSLETCRKATNLKIWAQIKSNIERVLQNDRRKWVVGCCEQGDEHFDFIKIYYISRISEKLFPSEEEEEICLKNYGGSLVTLLCTQCAYSVCHNVRTAYVTLCVVQ
jgi:hypothetical protein